GRGSGGQSLLLAAIEDIVDAGVAQVQLLLIGEVGGDVEAVGEAAGEIYLRGGGATIAPGGGHGGGGACCIWGGGAGVGGSEGGSGARGGCRGSRRREA